MVNDRSGGSSQFEVNDRSRGSEAFDIGEKSIGSINFNINSIKPSQLQVGNGTGITQLSQNDFELS